MDLADFPHIDHRHDVRRLPMVKDGAAELIYACHVLEYFDRVEVKPVLREWHRVLKPGGVLRVAVPDFSALIEVYRECLDLSLIHGPLYGRNVIFSEEGERTIHHRTAYDFQALEAVLVSAGFRDPRRYDWRTTPHGDIDDFSQAYIPHLDKEHGRLIA